jgi:hypothetical protein
MDETPKQGEEESFSALTAQLIEQAAALAGERMSAPIKAAAQWAVRALTLAGLGVGAFLVGLTFLAVTIGYALRLAPEEYRLFICFGVALAFMVLGFALAFMASRGRDTETKGSGQDRPH